MFSTHYQRQNFTKRTKEILSKRVAYRCSNPNCNKLTIGPSKENKTSSTTIGIAAHIKAASPGGARYDKKLTPEQRNSIENGIWLCVSCSTIIDKEPKTFPPRLLYKWKNETEKLIRNEFEIAKNHIDQLKQIQQTQIANGNILVRKKFNLIDLSEMISFMGYAPLIRQVRTQDSLNFFLNEFTIYSTIGNPKILTFSINGNNKLSSAVLINKLEFEGKSNIELSDSTKNRIEFKNISAIKIEHNNIQYCLVKHNETKKNFKVLSESEEFLTGKTIQPQFLVFAKPKHLKVDYIDVYVELLAIDFLFRSMFDFSSAITWKINLKAKNDIDKSLRLADDNSLYWVVTGELQSIPFIDFYFYKDINSKIAVLPKTDDDIVARTLQDMFDRNYGELKKHNFNSILLEYFKIE